MNQGKASEIRLTTDTGAQRIARVYAEAFLNAADLRGQTDAAVEELESLLSLFGSDSSFAEFVASGAIGRRHKEAAFQKIFGGRASEVFLNFLLVLNDHQRLELIPTILHQVRQIIDARSRRIRVQVKSAVPLDDAHRLRLEDEIRKNMSLEPVVEAQVEPELLGGLVVRVGDWLFDGSVRTELEHIRNEVTARSSYEIQSRRDRFSLASGN
jgi:F-type H+-transporting ATPase subunit delta